MHLRPSRRRNRLGRQRAKRQPASTPPYVKSRRRRNKTNSVQEYDTRALVRIAAPAEPGVETSKALETHMKRRRSGRGSGGRVETAAGGLCTREENPRWRSVLCGGGEFVIDNLHQGALPSILDLCSLPPSSGSLTDLRVSFVCETFFGGLVLMGGLRI